MRWILLAVLCACGGSNPPCECPKAADWFPVTDKWADGSTYHATRCFCRVIDSIDQQPMDTNPQMSCEQNAEVFGNVCANQGLPLR